jgi:HK97 family phage prohead protease
MMEIAMTEELNQGETQGSCSEPMDETMPEQTPVRYSAIEIEHRRIGGRDVEFRTVEVDGLQLRAVEADTEMPMRFAGYAAVFNSPSEPLPFIETIAPGAFRRSLKSDSEKRMFLNHNTDQVLASTRSATLSLSEDDRGLYVEAELPDTTYGRDLSILMQRGDVHSMSFGFSVPRGGDSWSEDGTSRELREVILHEVSVVTGFPAYPATEGAQVRSTEEIAEPITEAEDGLPVDLARRMLELNAKR